MRDLVGPATDVMTRVSVRDAERHSLPLWPWVERVPLGDWELRTDPAPVGRLIKRANSCLAVGDPGVPLAAAADAVRRFYRDRDRPALVQVERGSTTERAFAELGWQAVAGGDSHFLLAAVADVLGRLGDGSEAVLDEDGPRVRVARVVDGVEVGSGRGAVDEDWVAVHALAVDPAYRRRGHARALLAALLRWGAARGGAVVWLHVETDNAAASALYDDLGFTTHHSCRYFRGPDAPARS
jgi:ribosomal protein S18 acetylase RimI-like enzyme